MHDKNGTELKKGDVVLLPAVVTDVKPGSEYCNVSIQSLHGRRPDGLKEHSTLNTGMLVLHDRPEALTEGQTVS